MAFQGKELYKLCPLSAFSILSANRGKVIGALWGWLLTQIMFVLSVQRSEELERYWAGGAEEEPEETGGLCVGDTEPHDRPAHSNPEIPPRREATHQAVVRLLAYLKEWAISVNIGTLVILPLLHPSPVYICPCPLFSHISISFSFSLLAYFHSFYHFTHTTFSWHYVSLLFTTCSVSALPVN